ncbi:ditrans,polycis-undecaprenyl-diphosphate synthase ((2E,6E)-farnesyl-diphosphate specific) [Ixodes scapularis]|nr:ditrans,polycis-undecaprenyl-diphosphate synthase ((2E,6E)-farnesyl-diphosphate specific) [Ixodes scapularis]
MDLTQGAPQGCEATTSFLHTESKVEPTWLEVPMPWYAKVLSWLLSLAQLPHSVALVPDGNRRWAKQRAAPLYEGHIRGVFNIQKFQAAAIALGILQSSVYAFSVRNLMRPEDQKRYIFNIMGVIAGNIIKNWELYQKKRWSVMIPGDVDLLSDDVRKRIATAELLTHQTRAEAQIFYAASYSSQHQMSRMALTLCHAVKEGLLEPRDITASLIDRYIEIEDGPMIDCYLRTSGERRLSDFMTWQSERAAIYFLTKNFPDFVLLDMFKMMLHYSAPSSSRKRLEDCYLKVRNRTERRFSVAQRLKERKFQSWLEAKRQAHLRLLAGSDH